MLIPLIAVRVKKIQIFLRLLKFECAASKNLDLYAYYREKVQTLVPLIAVSIQKVQNFSLLHT